MPDCNDVAAGQTPGSDWTPEDFEELMRCCGENISRFCCGQLGKFDGQDAIQETFMNAWSGRAGFDPDKLGPGGLKGWLGSIARHVCSNMLRKRHPSLVKIGNKKYANAVVNSPIAVPLYVRPAVAIFSAMNLPQWLTLDRKPKGEPTARQFLRGSSPTVGRFEMTLVASYNAVQATQPLILTVFAEAPPPAAETEKSEDTNKPADQDTPRAKHETIQEAANSDPNLTSDSPMLGAEMDVKWLLARLSDLERKVIFRTFWKEETDEEIETALNLNKGHTKRIRWIAMRKLRR